MCSIGRKLMCLTREIFINGINVEVFTDDDFDKKVTNDYQQSYYSIMLFRKRSGEFVNVNFKEMELSDYNVMVVRPGDTVNCGGIANYMELCMDSEFFTTMLPYTDLLEAVPVIFDRTLPNKYDADVEVCEKLKTTFMYVRSLLKDRCVPITKFIVLAAVIECLSTLQSLYNPFSDVYMPITAEKTLAFRFYELVETHFREMRAVKDYAALLCVTEKTLLRATKKAMGLTPKQIIMRCLVHEAKRLLIYKECSVLDVAQALGFDGMNAFVSSFKSIEGVTPSEFLKRRDEC